MPNLPDLSHPFARTNIQTIYQRVHLLKELVPGVRSIAEICCGDYKAQSDIYRAELAIEHFSGLDLSPEVVALNRARGIACAFGSALDETIIRTFLNAEVIFFGPPLSQDCDGHHLLAFQEVTPGFSAFTDLLLHELNYLGLLVLIGPRTLTPGDAQWMDFRVRAARPDYRLRLLHYSHATLTGLGEETPMRLKSVEMWFQRGEEPQWEIRESRGMA